MKPFSRRTQISSDSATTTSDAMVRFSIVVPVYEQWELVQALLDSLSKQTLSRDRFEVVLVDNASCRFGPPMSLPPNVRIFRCDTPGSYAARNFGSRQAKGEWLIFTDADCRPTPEWLARIDEEVVRHGRNTLIAGAVDVVGSTVRPGAWEIYDMVKGIPQERYVAHGYAATANLAVSAVFFNELGGFDHCRFSGGDADFCRRAGLAGASLIYARDARVEHPARTTWKEIATKARRVKGGQVAAGSAIRRLTWLLRTLIPPIRGAWYFMWNDSHTLRHRSIAVLVLGRVWAVELAETVRLAAGFGPERR